ncbi:LamG domain-containing protein [Halorubrum laminariae]|uniref:LamG domain-containing protein n=1 Tax=Halorubrum laminariae TaxID=1433523 RepID=A0ABD6BYV5_9EURY|nr:LamG domain-containing protein [Halorubrum laminariae]
MSNQGKFTTNRKTPAEVVAWGSAGWEDDLDDHSNITISQGRIKPQVHTRPPSGITHWTFNDSEIQDTTISDVWGDHNGTLHSVTTSVEGRSSDAYSFDGSGFIEFDRDILSELSQTSFSIAIRVYRTGPGAIIGFISDNHDDYILLRQRSDYPNFRLSNQLELDTPWATYTDRWVDIILVFSIETDSLTLYIENEQVDETTITNALPLDLTNERASIGRDPRSYDRGFHGRISDLRFYNKAITQDEVDRLYHTGSIIP